MSKENQLNNHNNSKKHKQNVQKIIKEVQLPEEIPENKRPPNKKNQQKKKNIVKDPQEEEEEEEKITKTEKSKNQNKKKELKSKIDNEEETNPEKLNLKERKISIQSSDNEDSEHIYKFATKKKTEIDFDESDDIEKPKENKKNKINSEVKCNPIEKKVGKAKQKREKKKNLSQEFICRVCNTDFTTKNKLFSHLKDLGHEKGNI